MWLCGCNASGPTRLTICGANCSLLSRPALECVRKHLCQIARSVVPNYVTARSSCHTYTTQDLQLNLRKLVLPPTGRSQLKKANNDHKRCVKGNCNASRSGTLPCHPARNAGSSVDATWCARPLVSLLCKHKALCKTTVGLWACRLGAGYRYCSLKSSGSARTFENLKDLLSQSQYDQD